jgi:hypothetical protein
MYCCCVAEQRSTGAFFKALYDYGRNFTFLASYTKDA